MLQNNDYVKLYEVLGLESDASWDDVRATYKKLAQTWHPDRFPGESEEQKAAELQFQEINNAFTIIEGFVRSHGIPPLLYQHQQEQLIKQAEAIIGKKGKKAKSGFGNRERATPNGDEHSTDATTQSNNDPLDPNYRYGAHHYSNFSHSESDSFHTNTAHNEQRKQNDFAARSQYRNQRKREILKNFYTYVGLVTFLLVLGFIYTTWIKKPNLNSTQNTKTEQIKVPANYTAPSIVEVTKGVTKAVANQISTLSENQGGPDPELPKVSELEEILPDQIAASKTTTVIQKSPLKRHGIKGNRFSYGDTMTTVINIHGPPHKMEKNRHYDSWHYGGSIIYFENGKVKEWITHPSYPLATSLGQ